MQEVKSLQGIFFRNFGASFIPNILSEIYIDQLYGPFLHDKKDMIIVDAGANVGITAFAFYPFAKKIIAIEPCKEHLETMKYMLEFNKMTDKVIIVPKALTNEKKTTKLYHQLNETAHTLTQLNVKFNRENKIGDEEIETITIKDLFDDYNLEYIDFLKLDTEGEEMRIISSSEFEKLAPKIKSILVEWHEWSMVNPDQLRACLIDYGYKVTPIVTKDNATLLAAVQDV